MLNCKQFKSLCFTHRHVDDGAGLSMFICCQTVREYCRCQPSFPLSQYCVCAKILGPPSAHSW